VVLDITYFGFFNLPPSFIEAIPVSAQYCTIISRVLLQEVKPIFTCPLCCANTISAAILPRLKGLSSEICLAESGING
jgi:hypothetical protein